MMRKLCCILIGSAWLLHGSMVRAADHPVLAPTKDVAVVYQLTGASKQNGAGKVQVAYASSGRVRMDFFRTTDAPSSFASLLFDPPADRVTTVLPERKAYLQRNVGNLVNPGTPLNDKMNFTRKGSTTIAGLSCTDWDVANGAAGQGTVCVTDDGVLLRATRDKPVAGSMEAIHVTYGPTPANIFTPPPDYAFIPSKESPNIKPPASAAAPTPNAATPPKAATPASPPGITYDLQPKSK